MRRQGGSGSGSGSGSGGRGGGRGRISRFARDGGGLKIVGKVPKFLLDIEAQHPGVLSKTAVGSLPDGKQQQQQRVEDAPDAVQAADDCSGDDPVEQEAFQRALVEQGLDENGNPLPKKQDSTHAPPPKRRPVTASSSTSAPPKLVAGPANTMLKSLSNKQQHSASKEAPKVNHSLLSFSVDEEEEEEEDEE